MVKREPVIRVRNLVYRYPHETTASLSVKTLNLYENEILGIVGRFGSGKSLLLRHLNGSIVPQSGDVEIAGRSVHANPQSPFYQIVGLLMENSDDQIFLSVVRDDIAFGPKNLNISRSEVLSRVQHATQILDIEHLLDREVTTLSLGEKKLVALAGVLAMQTEVLLLDAPTDGLDFWTRNEITRKILNLRENHSIAITINDYELLDKVDRIIYMEKGELVRTFYSADKFREFVENPTAIK